MAQSGIVLIQALKNVSRLVSIDEVPVAQLRAGGRGKLDLKGKGLGQADAGMLAELFKDSTLLSHLNLGNNHLLPGGGAALSLGLPLLVKLQKLELDHNELGEAGGVSVSVALKSMTSLTVLQVCLSMSLSQKATLMVF